MNKVKYYYKTDLFKEKRYIVKSKYKHMALLISENKDTCVFYKNYAFKKNEFYTEITKKEFKKEFKKISLLTRKKLKTIYNEINF